MSLVASSTFAPVGAKVNELEKRKLIRFLLPLLFATNAVATPMTPREIQQALLLIPEYGEFDSKAIKETAKYVEDQLKKYNIHVLPDAIAVGVVMRCQFVLGVCIGEQVNIGKVGKQFVVSLYDFYSGQLGLAEYLTAEVYVAFCYGRCNDVEAEGWYVSMDGSAALGAGANVFIEMGSDVTVTTDIATLINSGVFYIGAGIMGGEGGGISLGLMRYNLSCVKKLNSLF